MHPYFEDYWPWYVASWALTTPGAVLLLWALFRDRAKRGGVVRLRCPKCWYDMRGVAANLDESDAFPADLRCPECGRGIRSRRHLRRTRPRKRWAIIGLVSLCGGYFCFKHPNAYFGLTSYLPNTLAVIAPLPQDELERMIFGSGDDLSSTFWFEIQAKFGRPEIWRWQEHVIFDRLQAAYIKRGEYGATEAERALHRRVKNNLLTLRTLQYRCRL